MGVSIAEQVLGKLPVVGVVKQGGVQLIERQVVGKFGGAVKLGAALQDSLTDDANSPSLTIDGKWKLVTITTRASLVP